MYPFDRHSYILYDFLRNNDFEVANFNCEQDVSYTYFNTISRSYIDHVFISKDARNTVTACAIVSDLPSNVSDHFPMCTTLGVCVTSKELDIAGNGVSSFPNFPRVDWSDNKNCTAYSRYMDVATASLPGVNFVVQALYDMTSHKLQQKLFYLFCTSEGILFDMWKVLRDHPGGKFWNRVMSPLPHFTIDLST